jgi:anti-sigma B factor antagonist
MASITQEAAADSNPHLTSILGVTDATSYAATLSLRGALCAVTAAGHARELDELVEQGFIDLRIDLDDLALCTSDGLDAWDDLQHRLDAVQGRLTLSGAHGVVRRVLDVVTRGDEHFCPTVLPAA